MQFEGGVRRGDGVEGVGGGEDGGGDGFDVLWEALAWRFESE